MKKLIVTTMMAIALMAGAQDVTTFVERQLAAYPKARLLDIYKSCFQDCMGAEHLVADRASAKAYLEQELTTAASNPQLPWYYEPCGLRGRHVRVNLRAVTDGLITSDLLLDAFVRSANAAQRPTVEQWAALWHQTLDTIERMPRHLPHIGRDRQFIDSVLAAGQYAISHSRDYRDAYYPHYRIVERGIFERELKPWLEEPHKLLTQQHQQTMQQNISEVQEYLKECGVFYIATNDGEQPRVRPFGVSEIINGRLYIMTGKVKDVFRQMNRNGKFEICALKSSGSEWLRLSGTLVNDEDLSVKQVFLERNPSLKRMYSPDDGNMAVLYITDATARFCSFADPERTVTF